MGDFCGFFFSVKGCEAERCLWQMQRGEARAKQRETELCKGFDYVLPMGKKPPKKKSLLNITGTVEILRSPI